MTMRAFALLCCLTLLAGCGGTRTLGSLESDSAPDQADIPEDIASIPDAVPRDEPLSRYGNPDSYVVLGKRYEVLKSNRDYRQRGDASWYGRKFHGRATSSGEPYDMYAMTAAHKTLPLPSYVRVTNLANDRQVVVRVNDRGPFHSDRIIDLSYAAAVRLDMIGDGTAPVLLETLHAGASPDNADNDPTLYLQAGAFADAAYARRLAQRLASLGLERVFVSPSASSDQAGKPLYRVRVGPFADDAHLQQARSLLTREGIQVSALRE